jgi:predicted ATPase/class 3 adenylate cyclase
MSCGSPLVAGAGERRERRLISVLFADLVGFTSRSEHIDIEDVGVLVSSYQQLLRREVESCGGFVVNFAGDGIMAIFGAPKAHEDDPERAVRAGLTICESVADLLEPSATATGLRVRVGITTGEALISYGGSRELDAAGDVVNTAARLQTAAPAGGVLVDTATHRATARVIRYHPAEAVEAKGKQDTVAVWLALEPRSLVPAQVREQLLLVGREREANLLRGLLERAHLEPSTELVTVVGPPGIGKTRLVSELELHVEQLPDLITWRQGRSLAYGSGIAFWALGEMVKAQAGIIESDSVAVAGDKLRDCVAAVCVEERDRAWVEQQLRPLAGLAVQTVLSVEGGRAEAFAAWRRFFEALAEDGPTVLIFEDVQWADDALLDFIDVLADRAGAVPLLIVCTARPELLERRHGWGGGKTNALTVGLSPLSGDDTARLASQLLDQALLPAELQQALVARAEGNPLYVQEYVRMLQAQGLLVREAGDWQLKGEAAGLPESVHGIVAARLDTLSPVDKAFIQDAAVLGRSGWLGGVRAIGERSAWQAEESLHQLERAQLLLRLRRSSIEGEIEFIFAHALTQEVAYGQIPRAERAARHEQAAVWIEQLAGRREDKAELLAHHYSTALELHNQAGHKTGALAARARVALIQAGRQAHALTAHATAAGHYKLALGLTAADDPGRSRVLYDYALTRSLAGTPDEVLFQTALDAQVASADWERAAWMEHILAEWAAFRVGDRPRADAHNARAASHAARVPERAIYGLVAAARAYGLLVAGRTEEALAFVTEAERINQNAEGGALLLCRRGWALFDLGHTGGIDDVHEGCRRLAKLNSPRAALEYSNLAEDLAGFGDLAGATQARETAAKFAARTGEADTIDWVDIGRAEGAYHAGSWDDALPLCTTLVEGDERLNAAFARSVRGRIVLGRGDIQTAAADAEEILAYAESTDNAECYSMGLALRALALHADARPREALEACNAYLARWLFRSPGNRSCDLVAIALILTGPERRGALLEAAQRLPDDSPVRHAITAIAEDRDELAAELFDAIGAHPDEAGAHGIAARRAVDNGRFDDAARYATTALDFYRRVSATLYCNQIELLLAEARDHTRGQSA